MKALTSVLSSYEVSHHLTGPFFSSFFMTVDAQLGVDLLLACHSTPGYSYLHRNVSIYYPECLPM